MKYGENVTKKQEIIIQVLINVPDTLSQTIMRKYIKQLELCLIEKCKKHLSPYELGKEGFGADQTHEGDIAQNSKKLLKARF